MLLLLLAAPAFSACEGCLNLDEYTLVASDGASGSGGSAGTSPTICDAQVFEGTLFASFVASGAAGATSGPCGAPATSEPGIELLAIDPAQGNCIARARIIASSGASFETKPRVRQSSGAVAALAGSLSSGTLEFPQACTSGASIVLRPEAGANQTLFVSRLRLEGAEFCTEWLRRAWTTETTIVDPLAVHALELAADGSLAIAGTLGDHRTLFEGGPTTSELRGGGFVASFSSGGTLRSKVALLAAGSGEALMGLSSTGSSWLATGTLRAEDPMCHPCGGVSHVGDPAGVCPPGAAGAGGAAGAAGTDASSAGAGGGDASSAGAGGVDASSAGAGGGAGVAPVDGGEDRRAAASDARNLVLFLPQGDRCGHMESFGSDQFADDLQIGFDVSRTTQTCGAYFTGLAGRNVWRLSGSDSATSLAPSRDAIADGFIARMQGGQSVGCATAGSSFSLRLESSGAVVGDHVAAERCREGAVASLFVPSAAGQSVELKLCRSAGGCTSVTERLSLGPDVDEQVTVMDIGGSGELRWHTSFGPVRAPPDAARGSFVGRPDFDLALDDRDHIYLVLQTSGALRTSNALLTRCRDLEAASPASGTWLIQLERGGSGARGECRWAKLVSP